jgi:hypothetical protein
VTSPEYAAQIARDWNTKASSFAGYVTSFNFSDDYISTFDRHVVGSAIHEEYWIPAEQLPTFNSAIRGPIEVEAAFFGESFVGFVPDKYGLKGKNAEQQFVILVCSWDYSRMDFVLEVSANRKAVYLNCLYWLQHDFSALRCHCGSQSCNSRRSRRDMEPQPNRSGIAVRILENRVARLSSRWYDYGIVLILTFSPLP